MKPLFRRSLKGANSYLSEKTLSDKWVKKFPTELPPLQVCLLLVKESKFRRQPIIFHEISLFSKMAQIRKTIFFLSKYSLSLGIGGMFIYPKFTDIFNILFKSRKHWIFSASFLRKKLEWNAKLCNVRWWFYVTEKDNSPYCQIAIFFSLFLIKFYGNPKKSGCSGLNDNCKWGNATTFSKQFYHPHTVGLEIIEKPMWKDQEINSSPRDPSH